MLRRGASVPSLRGIDRGGAGGRSTPGAASPAHSRGFGGSRPGLGRRNTGGARSVLGDAGMSGLSQQLPHEARLSDLQNRKGGPSLALLRGPPVVASSFLMESRARVNMSMVSAEMDRRQGNKLMQINRALDTEMDDLFESLVKKRGALKVESLPLQRVGSDGRQLEPLEGGPPAQVRPEETGGRRAGEKAGGGCSVCMKELRPGEVVRPMIHCCNAPQHALCLRAFVQREACCPGCRAAVLNQSELRELLETVR